MTSFGGQFGKDIKLRSDWRAFGVNFLFLPGTHAAKWVQHPLKNETHTSNFRLMARQSERDFTRVCQTSCYCFIAERTT